MGGVPGGRLSRLAGYSRPVQTAFGPDPGGVRAGSDERGRSALAPHLFRLCRRGPAVLLHDRAVGLLDDVHRAANPQNAVIDDMTVLEGQLPTADEPRESPRVRTAKVHHAGVAWVGSQLLSREVKGPVPIHIHVLVGDQHDAM